ncbi:MAG: HigA family addiction module antitoxin [Alphaproteobacteria bacterium]
MKNNPALIELKKLMKKHNLNQHQIAFRIFVPASRISQILKAERRFTLETDLKLCTLFGLRPLYFFNMQIQYELTQAKDKYKETLQKIIVV